MATSRGPRKRDYLSPYFDKGKEEGLLDGHEIHRERVSTSHLQLADDTIFSSSEEVKMTNLLSFFF